MIIGRLHDRLRCHSDILETTRKLADQLGVTKVYIGGSTLREAVLYLAMQRDLPGASPFDSNDTFIAPAPGAEKSLYLLSSADDRVGQVFAERLGGTRVASYDVPGADLRYSFYSASPSDVAGLFADVAGTPISVTFDGRVRLDGYHADPELRPGGLHQLALRWTLLQSTRPDTPTYCVYDRLMDQLREVDRGAEFAFHAVGRWQRGERVISWRDLPVPADLAPGVYSYLVGLYHFTPASYRNASAVDAAGTALGDGVRLASLVVRPTGVANPTRRLSARFGSPVALEGFDLVEEHLGAGGTLDIALYWKALDRMERD